MNGQEIEAKFYVTDLKRIELHLRELKAHVIQPRMHETNLRFDTPDRSLRREGRVLRLRQDDQARMTYKGASVEEDGVLSREEVEFIVEDFGRAKRFLEALGYEVMIFYEKFRTTYALGDIHIMLDEIPYGFFVEIEGNDIESIREMAGLLGLKWEPIATSYHALFERICKALGLYIKDLSFDNFNGIKVSANDLSVTPAA